jgi:hypothetical protein
MLCCPRNRFNGADLRVASDAVAVATVVAHGCEDAEFEVPQGELQTVV